MSAERLGINLFVGIALLAAGLAGSAIWLLLSDPVTVADAITEGEVTPLVSALADLLYRALLGLLRYL